MREHPVDVPVDVLCPDKAGMKAPGQLPSLPVLVALRQVTPQSPLGSC